MRMRVVDRLGHLEEVHQRLVLGNHALSPGRGLQAVLNRAAGDIGHHQICYRLIVRHLLLAVVMDRENVRMVQRGGGARLALKAHKELLIIAPAQGQDLQGNLALQAWIFGQPDLAHAAASNSAQKAIAAQGCRRSGVIHDF